MALAGRDPHMEVEGVEVSATNVRIARQLNRFANARFRQGLAEEVHETFPKESFDLIYSFAVLEHVRDVEETIRSIMAAPRPGGRSCFRGPLPEVPARGPTPGSAPAPAHPPPSPAATSGSRYPRCRPAAN